MERMASKHTWLGPFWWSLITFVAVYLFFKIAFPYIAMWAVEKEQPLPIPASAMAMYMILTLVGILVYVTSSDALMREFFQPIGSLLVGSGGTMFQGFRWGILLLIPLFIGWRTFSYYSPSMSAPIVSRIAHPTMPGQYEDLENPFQVEESGDVSTSGATIPEHALLAREYAQKIVGELQKKENAILEEGRALYQINCRPCHGTKADGTGPHAAGYRLKPANFTDPGTIATVVEGFTFWRVTEGGIALPPGGTPWDSAMPRWKDNLSDEEIWKIILAEYAIAGTEPRKPEKLH